MNPFPNHPGQTEPLGSRADGTAERIAAEHARIDALLEELRARTDAVIDEQSDRMERWQAEQETRFERALREHRAWFELRLADLAGATDGAGGAVQQAARRAVGGIDLAVTHARTETERTAAQAHLAAADAVRALSDARATIERTAADAQRDAEQTIRQIQEAIDAATLRARQSVASIEEGLAHHSASLASRAEDAISRASAAVAGATGGWPDQKRDAPDQSIERLEELIATAQRVAGIPPSDLSMPAHEAPAPWPPAPAPGSLPDLIAKAQSVLTRSRTLINDLARQTRAGENVRDVLECAVQDASAAVRGQREQLEEVRALLTSGFEAGYELESALGGAIAKARAAADRLDDSRHAGHVLRPAAGTSETKAA